MLEKPIYMRKEARLLLSILLLAAMDVSAAPAGVAQPFQQLASGDTLAQTSVYAFAQDPQGFLWIGSEDGLYRYDGYNFTVWQHEPTNNRSLSESDVSAINIDRYGQFWI